MKFFLALLISAVPIFEVRGGMVFASSMDIDMKVAIILCVIGNLIPIPFIFLLLRKVFTFLEHWKLTSKIVTMLENKARKNHEKLGKYKLLGLFLLVAIPLPFTGAYTGSLVAVLFDFRIKTAFPVIALGVITATAVMVSLSYGIPHLFGF